MTGILCLVARFYVANDVRNDDHAMLGRLLVACFYVENNVRNDGHAMFGRFFLCGKH